MRSQDEIDGRASNNGTEREGQRESRGLSRCKSRRGPEGPSLELWAWCRSGEGLEGAKAHSKAERLPVKVEGTNSLSRYCAPLLSSLLPFFQSASVARFHPSPWDRRVPNCSVLFCAVLCCAVLFCAVCAVAMPRETRRDANRLSESN